MSDWNAQANEIFLDALDQPAGEARANFVSRACHGDESLEAHVIALLKGNELAGEFLSSPGEEGGRTAFDDTRSEAVGSTIGPYTLLQEIGEGGMGVVYKAEQGQPVHRIVALKIVKPGMDSRQVIQRFEAERQALAMMEHPNIAKVLDVGVVTGRPYFVMELVKGVPITKYCDAHRLTIRQRLELFLPVCRAVQHAHQKGIIHRDLKSSNVLVTPLDGIPVPKVIDFGVAKSIGPKLTEHTVATEIGAVIGTIEYMSPEQAELSAPDVDTRSDVYSLGVLAYELLVGSTPVRRDRFKRQPALELLREVRERDVVQPTVRLADDDRRAAIAANRRTDAETLLSMIRGELDWIVMKALERDRDRRYQTASEFGADVARYLQGEPVAAGPPSVSYRLRKLAQKHRVSLFVAAIVAMSAIVSLAGIAAGVGWAIRERAAQKEVAENEQLSRQQRMTGQLEEILNDVERLETDHNWPAALVAARRAEPAMATGDAVPEVQQRANRALDDLRIVQRLDEIRAQGGAVWGTPHAVTKPLSAQADRAYADAFRQFGIDIDSLSTSQGAGKLAAHAEIAAAILPAMDDWVAVRSRGGDTAAVKRLTDVLRSADPDLWRQKIRDALAANDISALEQLAKSADVDHQPAATLSFLASSIRQHSEELAEGPAVGKRDPDLAKRGFDLEIEILRRAQRRFPDDFWINQRLGFSLIWWGGESTKDGISYMRAAIAARPRNAQSQMNLGTGFAYLGRYDEAAACYQRAIELAPKYGTCYLNLGIARRKTSQFAESIAAFGKVAEVQPDRFDLAAEANAELAMLLCTCPDLALRDVPQASQLAAYAIEHAPEVSRSWTALGIVYYRAGKWDEACAAFEKSLTLGREGLLGWNRWEEPIDHLFLAMCCWQLDRKNDAQSWYQRAVAAMESADKHHDLLPLVRGEADGTLRWENRE